MGFFFNVIVIYFSINFTYSLLNKAICVSGKFDDTATLLQTKISETDKKNKPQFATCFYMNFIYYSASLATLTSLVSSFGSTKRRIRIPINERTAIPRKINDCQFAWKKGVFS